MHIVLYGATGHIGARILSELLSRRHQVTAITRDPEKLTENAGLTVQQGDLSDTSQMAESIAGAEAVVSAYGPPAGHEDQVLGVTRRLIEAVQRVSQQANSGHATRLVMVGGAGSLEVAPGVKLMDAPNFPENYRTIAEAHARALDLLRASSIDWTSLSPSAVIEPGERTGKFRLAQDKLLTTSDGGSRISMEDFAIALVEELEQPQHRRQRFTVGY